MMAMILSAHALPPLTRVSEGFVTGVDLAGRIFNLRDEATRRSHALEWTRRISIFVAGEERAFSPPAVGTRVRAYYRPNWIGPFRATRVIVQNSE